MKTKNKCLLLCCFVSSTHTASNATGPYPIRKEDLLEGKVRVVPPFDRVLTTRAFVDCADGRSCVLFQSPLFCKKDKTPAKRKREKMKILTKAGVNFVGALHGKHVWFTLGSYYDEAKERIIPAPSWEYVGFVSFHAIDIVPDSYWEAKAASRFTIVSSDDGDSIEEVFFENVDADLLAFIDLEEAKEKNSS